jgi:hypothetical protein
MHDIQSLRLGAAKFNSRWDVQAAERREGIRSASGTLQTSTLTPSMSALRGKADTRIHSSLMPQTTQQLRS